MIIIICSIFSIVFGLINAALVLKVKIVKASGDGDLADKKVEDDEGAAIVNALSDEKL